MKKFPRVILLAILIIAVISSCNFLTFRPYKASAISDANLVKYQEYITFSFEKDEMDYTYLSKLNVYYFEVTNFVNNVLIVGEDDDKIAVLEGMLARIPAAQTDYNSKKNEVLEQMKELVNVKYPAIFNSEDKVITEDDRATLEEAADIIEGLQANKKETFVGNETYQDASATEMLRVIYARYAEEIIAALDSINEVVNLKNEIIAELAALEIIVAEIKQKPILQTVPEDKEKLVGVRDRSAKMLLAPYRVLLTAGQLASFENFRWHATRRIAEIPVDSDDFDMRNLVFVFLAIILIAMISFVFVNFYGKNGMFSKATKTSADLRKTVPDNYNVRLKRGKLKGRFYSSLELIDSKSQNNKK